MKKILFYILLPVCFLFACQDHWDDHYKQETGNSDGENASMNLLEYLEAKPEYSEFVKLLKETGVAEELTRNQVLTVWAPTNETFPSTEIAGLTDQKKMALCRNHLNYIALYNTKLEDSKLIKTLAGKNLEIKEPALDQFSIDGREVVELNGKCTNGVVHKIAGWLMPRKSIYEYIVEAGPEYSVFRDTLLSYNDTIFQPGSSFPLDVDSLGNTIYDSVFIVENRYLSMADLRDEDQDFTLFLPSNAVINAMFQTMADYFEGVGRVFSQNDSARFFRWTLNAVMHKDRIESYNGEYRSAFGQKWIAEKEPVGEREELSNGYIYKLSNLYVPKNLYLDTLKFYPYDTFFAYKETDKLDEYFWSDGGTCKGTVMDNHNVVYVNCPGKSPEVKFSFKTVTKDVWGNYIDGKVMPGIYNIKASFRNWASNNVKMSINDNEITTFNASSSTYGYKGGLVKKSFEIPEEWGYNMLTIQLENVGGSDRMSPEYFLFEPTDENY